MLEAPSIGPYEIGFISSQILLIFFPNSAFFQSILMVTLKIINQKACLIN